MYILRTNQPVYTRNILDIDLVYQNLTGICMVYTWYIHGILKLQFTNMPSSSIFLGAFRPAFSKLIQQVADSYHHAL